MVSVCNRAFIREKSTKRDKRSGTIESVLSTFFIKECISENTLYFSYSFE